MHGVIAVFFSNSSLAHFSLFHTQSKELADQFPISIKEMLATESSYCLARLDRFGWRTQPWNASIHTISRADGEGSSCLFQQQKVSQ
jgi:hypothetical protein